MPEAKTQNPIHRMPKAASRAWILITAVLLLAAVMRFPALDRVPPGWRDDELIEFDMDMRIQEGWRPLYIREAEGHEPLYHYMHAGTLTLLGRNTLGYRWLPAALGTLCTALLLTLARRLFGLRAAALAGALYGVGLWPVLYSRFGVRHIGVMPFALLTLYALVRMIDLKRPGSPHSPAPVGEACLAPTHRTIFGIPPITIPVLRFGLIAGVAMGLGLYVYFAARVAPALVVLLAVYLFIFDRPRLARAWPGFVLALVTAGLIFSPLGLELARGPAETRLQVTGGPLMALMRGDPLPAMQTTLGTLGMFTFAGDPEWLYNFSRQPVFDWATGLVFYAGLALCLLRMRDARYGFVLVWWAVGLAPAFVSIPPASYSHTILAQGAVYLIPALAVTEIAGARHARSANLSPLPKGIGTKLVTLPQFKLAPLLFVASVLLVAWVGRYTGKYYFSWWANHAMVRFQYHAETHELARWLDATPGSGEVAVSTTTTEFVLDPLALRLDLKRKDIQPRWFDAEWAMVYPGGGGGRMALLSFPGLNPLLERTMNAELVAEVHNPPTGQLAFRVYRDLAAPGTRGQGLAEVTSFRDGRQALPGEMALLEARVAEPPPAAGGDGYLLTTWRVAKPLSGPLKLFVHLLDAQGNFVAGDDRLNVLAGSLRPGDVFVQVSRLPRPAGVACTPCRLDLGIYDPDTNERLFTPAGADHFQLPVEVRP